MSTGRLKAGPLPSQGRLLVAEKARGCLGRSAPSPCRPGIPIRGWKTVQVLPGPVTFLPMSLPDSWEPDPGAPGTSEKAIMTEAWEGERQAPKADASGPSGFLHGDSYLRLLSNPLRAPQPRAPPGRTGVPDPLCQGVRRSGPELPGLSDRAVSSEEGRPGPLPIPAGSPQFPHPEGLPARCPCPHLPGRAGREVRARGLAACSPSELRETAGSAELGRGAGSGRAASPAPCSQTNQSGPRPPPCELTSGPFRATERGPSTFLESSFRPP